MSSATSHLPNVRGGNLQEIYFAQRLADNEKPVRDKALDKLKVYLTLKTSANGPGFTDDEALKVWKGLFYCMYNADKPLVQEEVAEDISYLIHDVGNGKDRYTFISAAFRTFAREWNGIDIFRLDKYMMFMRRVLRQVFVSFKLSKWGIKELVRFMNMLDETIIRADDQINTTPLGIKLHLCGIILEELAKIGGEDIDNKIIHAVIKPFLKVVAVSRQDVYRDAVADDIVRHLMRQTDLGVNEEDKIEFTVKRFLKAKKKKKGKWSKRAKIPIGDKEDDDEETVVDEGDDEEEEEMEERNLEDAVLDPRAGEVNVYIPQLKPDFELLAKTLQEMGSIKKVNKVNRHLVYQLASECKDMAGNVYPLRLPKIVDDVERYDEKSAAKDLHEFYNKLKNVKSVEKELEELRDDPLKNFSLEKSKSKRSNKKKKKVKRLDKKIVSLTKKKAISKELVAAEVNRVKAVEGKLSQINQEIGVPSIITLPMKRKNEEMSAIAKPPKKKKKKNKSRSNVAKVSKESNANKSASFEVSDVVTNANKSASFEVSDIATSDVEAKNKVSSSTDFEVTPISSKEESGNKQNISNSGESFEVMQGVFESALSSVAFATPSGQSEGMVNNLPKKVKSKKKKGKETKVKANGCEKSLGSVSKISTSDFHVSSLPVETADKNMNLSKENTILACKSPSKDTVKAVANTAQPELNNEETVLKKVTKNKTKKKSNGVAMVEVNAPESVVESGKFKVQTKKAVSVAGELPKKKNLQVAEISNISSPLSSKKITTPGKSPKKIASPGKSPKKITTPGKSPKKTPNKPKPMTMNFSGDENGIGWSKPMVDDIEMFIKSKRNQKLEKRRSGALFMSPKGTPKTPKSRERTIKINLKQNREHEFKDYVHSVRNSPQIPYSADKLPKAPVLKPSPSPILVGRPALKILKNVIKKSPGGKMASPLLKKKSPKAKKMKRSLAADFF